MLNKCKLQCTWVQGSPELSKDVAGNDTIYLAVRILKSSIADSTRSLPELYSVIVASCGQDHL
jgi:hypothetical protein